MAQYGIVSIVGAGPGDPDLLTVKALRRLREADAVVYDRLVPPEILARARRGAARIFAGKSCKQHHMTQDEINSLLAALAVAGKLVVRLKGGDPFVFGRGGEEAEYLASRGIPFEIVPGVGAASGCGGYAGIPLTHRRLATGVRYITGHARDGGGGPPDLDWRGLADPDTTLVVYMGLANLEVICRKLIEHGLAGSTPAAAVQDGTTKAQRVILDTLSGIARAALRENLAPPATVIIGRVAALAGPLAWFNQGREELRFRASS